MENTQTTPTQRRILCNVRDGKRFDYGRLFGRSAAGGWDRAYYSCIRKGWLAPDGALTATGRALLTNKVEMDHEAE